MTEKKTETGLEVQVIEKNYYLQKIYIGKSLTIGKKHVYLLLRNLNVRGCLKIECF